jgi:cytoskeletal protein CcmA (bactofilin family)
MVQKNDELPIKAYLGVDALFKGTLSFDGIVRIDGKFEGKIQTKDTLVIGETGEIIADVDVGILVCKGKLQGTVSATGKVEMLPASTIIGDVKAPAISIELGAVLDGNLNMTEKESQKIINLVEQKKQ